MVHHSDALYLFSAGQLKRIAGEGDAVNHIPKFQNPQPINIASGDKVLLSDYTFPGGQGEFLVSPGTENKNTAFIANETTNVATGDITYIEGSAMNAKGQIAIEATTSENSADILLDSGNGLKLVVGGANTSFSPNGGTVSVNNSGQVAFFEYGTGGSGLSLYSDGKTSFLTTVPQGYPYSLSLSGSDSLALFVQGTSPNQTGIYYYADGTLAPVAVNGSPAPGGGDFSYPFWETPFAPALNDNGALVFAAPLNIANQYGIYLFENNALSRVVGNGDIAPGGGTFTYVDSHTINSSGDIAFRAFTTSGIGIFVDNNSVISMVVTSGEKIAGESVSCLQNPLLSDSGHVAFDAELSNGTTAVFVARHAAAIE